MHWFDVLLEGLGIVMLMRWGFAGGHWLGARVLDQPIVFGAELRGCERELRHHSIAVVREGCFRYHLHTGSFGGGTGRCMSTQDDFTIVLDGTPNNGSKVFHSRRKAITEGCHWLLANPEKAAQLRAQEAKDDGTGD